MKPPPLEEQYRHLLGASAAVWPVAVASVPPDGYLVGGTALALRLQHRQSYDIDIFTPTVFRPERLSGHIRALSQESVMPYREINIGDRVLICAVADTRIEVVHDPLPLLCDPTSISGMPVAGIEDIAAMKVAASTDRAALRDRYDLMVIQQHTGWSHKDCFDLYVERYGRERAPLAAARLCHWLPYPEALPHDPRLTDIDGELVEGTTNDYWRNEAIQLLYQLSPYKRRKSPADWPTADQFHRGRSHDPPSTGVDF